MLPMLSPFANANVAVKHFGGFVTDDCQDEDLFVPIKNFGGETIGWRERTESDKLRRKR